MANYHSTLAVIVAGLGTSTCLTIALINLAENGLKAAGSWIVATYWSAAYTLCMAGVL